MGRDLRRVIQWAIGADECYSTGNLKNGKEVQKLQNEMHACTPMHSENKWFHETTRNLNEKLHH